MQSRKIPASQLQQLAAWLDGEPQVPEEALPADLVYLLISRLGLSEAEIAKMSKADAIARMQEHWSRPPEGDATR